MADITDIPPHLAQAIASYLELVDATSLARTSRYFAAICIRVHGNNIFQVMPNQGQAMNRFQVTGLVDTMNQMAAISNTTGTSPIMSSSSGTEFDSHASTDTELTTPEEDEWRFEITADLIRRLSKLPHRQSGATLPTLPTELQLQIFSYLDNIDSCCLGLTSPRTYSIYRSVFGVKMPLNTRRLGPNHLERAWELVGKQECAQCGIYRCELHQHIKSWMPKDLEYCSMKMTFGEPASKDSMPNCYRGKPSKPRRCGRHPLRTTSVHQDDNMALKTLA